MSTLGPAVTESPLKTSTAVRSGEPPYEPHGAGIVGRGGEMVAWLLQRPQPGPGSVRCARPDIVLLVLGNVRVVVTTGEHDPLAIKCSGARLSLIRQVVVVLRPFCCVAVEPQYVPLHGYRYGSLGGFESSRPLPPIR